MKMLPQVISVFLVKNILLKAFMPCNELNKVHGLIYTRNIYAPGICTRQGLPDPPPYSGLSPKKTIFETFP